MLISCTADIHSPIYLDLFKSSFEKAKEPDLLLLAGDICDVGEVDEYKKVLKILEKWKCPMVGVFGNTESRNSESNADYEKVKKMCKGKIKFLQEEILKMKISGKEIGIICSKGIFDRPWEWQVKRRPDIKELFEERFEKIKDLIMGLDTEFKILLLHHPPTFKTMIGEKPETFYALGSKRLEKILENSDLDLVVHAHAHNGAKFAFLGKTPVYNVSLPLNGKIVEIKKLQKAGLREFI